MFTAIYIAALLVDEDLADQVWEAWDKGEIDDQVAWIACFALGGAASVAGEEQHTALRRVDPHGKRRLVLGRVVPGLGGLFVWELDDDP